MSDWKQEMYTWHAKSRERYKCQIPLLELIFWFLTDSTVLSYQILTDQEVCKEAWTAQFIRLLCHCNSSWWSTDVGLARKRNERMKHDVSSIKTTLVWATKPTWSWIQCIFHFGCLLRALAALTLYSPSASPSWLVEQQVSNSMEICAAVFILTQERWTGEFTLLELPYGTPMILSPLFFCQADLPYSAHAFWCKTVHSKLVLTLMWKQHQLIPTAPGSTHTQSQGLGVSL